MVQSPGLSYYAMRYSITLPLSMIKPTKIQEGCQLRFNTELPHIKCYPFGKGKGIVDS
jgi:hypothetical protein